MRKILSIVLSLGLLFQQAGFSYAAGELNLANYLSQARSAIIQPDRFRPPQLRYISYDIKSNDFKLLLDKGDLKQPKEQNGSNDKLLTQELLNYFLIGLSLPNDTFWVNLRPDAADNIIDPLLEKTDIGKIFLESDLQLKKDTASFTSPQTPEGKQYWDKLYKKAGELFGTENITIPTITRPWIVPNEVIVRETDDSAYIYKATLKVMLEEDYLTSSRGGSRTAPTPDQYTFSDPRLKELNQYSTQLIKDTIIPKLTQELNSSQRYAKLRQVYYSLVLSRWFKMKYRGKPGEYPERIDRQNLTNLTSQQSWDKQTYFSQYQESFAKGEYNLKETVASAFGQSIRSYVSGGIMVDSPIIPGGFTTANKPVTAQLVSGIQPVASASPLTLDDVANDIRKAREELIRFYHKNNIDNRDVRLSTVTISELIEAAQEIASSRQRVNAMTLGDEAQRWYELAELLLKTKSRITENIKTYKEELVNFFTKEIKEIPYIKLNEDQKSYYSDIYALEIDKTLDIDIIVKAAEQAYHLRESFLQEEAEAYKAFSGHKEGAENESALPFSVRGQSDLPAGYSASPLGKELSVVDTYGRPLRYVYYWRLSDKGKDSLLEAFGKSFSDWGIKATDKNLRLAVRVNQANKIVAVVGALQYNIDTKVVGPIIIPKGADKVLEIESSLRKAYSEEIKQGERLFWDKTISSSTASPVTPEEIKSEALKALSDRSIFFHHYRTNYGLTPMNSIENASDSWEDVLKRLEDEIKKINAWPNGLRWEISSDADEIVRLFNELIKKSKGYALLGSNRLVEKRNDDAQKGSASPIILIDEDRKRIEEINEAISEGFKETSSLSTAHPDLEKPYQKIFKIINSRDTVAIAEAIKEFYEVVGGFFLTGLPMVGGINKKETDSEVKEWKNRGKYLLKISKYVRDEMNKRIDAEWKMLRLNEASKKGAKTIINNALEKKEFDKAANIMISLLNESMDSIRHFETEKMISDAENMIKAWEKISKEVSIISIVSSSLTVVDREENQGEKRGGIDLTDRAMHIKLERVGSFASSALVLPEIGNEETIDLDNEFRQIQAMVNSDIRPSDTRILEFAAACYYKGEFDQRLTQITDCIKNAHLADEGLGRESSEPLRLATMLPDALYAYGGK